MKVATLEESWRKQNDKTGVRMKGIVLMSSKEKLTETKRFKRSMRTRII